MFITKSRISALIVALLSTAWSSFALTEGTLKVLSIGTEFAQDAIVQDLCGIAQADGQPMMIGVLCGRDLETTLDWASRDEAAFAYTEISQGQQSTSSQGRTLAQVLSSERWDVIVLEQHPSLAIDSETIEPYLKGLLRYVRAHSRRGVRIMWHQSWAFEDEDQQSPLLWDRYGAQSAGMYADLMRVSRALCTRYSLPVIPTGSTIQNLRSGFTREYCTGDAEHLSLTIGRYAAACTWYEAITGQKTLGNAYVPVTLQNWVRRDAAQRAAHAAVLSPFELTSQASGTGAYHSDENGHYLESESEIQPYTLPDPLVMNDGTPVTTVEQWTSERRPELLQMFSDEIYGHSAPRQEGQHYKVLLEDPHALGGLATRKEIAIYFTSEDTTPYIQLLLYTPNKVQSAPCFLMMNFSGNIGVTHDETILRPTPEQLRAFGSFGYPQWGMHQDRYPIEMLIDRGYAFATFYKGDVDPDRDDGFQDGVEKYIYRENQIWPDPDQWAAISAWAWGHSRVLDYLETDDDVDASRVSVVGHSRGGKTALWAAAQDTRFAMAVANCSGCMGAAISKRKMGQTARAIQVTFPQWFCTNFLKYMDNEEALPVDQHELIALIAPRPVYVASASLDLNADPRGELLGLVEAMPVYQMYGYRGLDSTDFPEPGVRIDGDRMAYHLRDGIHAIQPWDWLGYIQFADKYLK